MSEQLLAALRSVAQGVAEHQPSQLFALFSGGDDSLCSSAIAALHPRFKGCIHLDTRTGVPATRQFVEATCAAQGWPLFVYAAPEGEYERLVLEGYQARGGRLHRGFPHGPTSHNTMYWYLKQRQLRAALQDHKQGHHDRIGFVTGVRAKESDRRMRAQLARPHYKDTERSIVWLQPILDWSKADCLDFLAALGLERNPVSVNCHRSGECLCGALANHAELAEIAFFYPEVGERYAQLQAEAQARGIPDWQWAGGPTATRRVSARSAPWPLCTSCQLALWD